MTEEEIIENNKLIAEFIYDSKDWSWLNKNYDCHINSLNYHCDWNWLIVAVEKIESIEDYHHGYFGVHISSNSCIIQGTNLWKAIKHPTIDENRHGYGYVYMSDPNAILDSKLESTYYNVVEFIKWYNENLKK